MKSISWNKRKNEILKKERGISFEDVIKAIERGRLLDTVKNPNQTLYKNQYFFIVQIKDYVYVVPFRLTVKGVTVITIYPSRKYKKKYEKK